MTTRSFTINLLTALAQVLAVSAHAAPTETPKPSLELTDLRLASPLVTAGRPFTVLLTAKNAGKGPYPAGDSVRLEASAGGALDALGQSASRTLALGVLEPGQSTVLRWEGLVAPARGDWTLSADAPGISVKPALSFHAFDAEPETTDRHSEEPETPVLVGRPIAAEVSNATSRLSLVLESAPDRKACGDGYAIAETWDGRRWRRAGSLYPLARVVIRRDDGVRVELRLKYQGIEASNGCLTVRFLAEDTAPPASDNEPHIWPVTLTFAPAGGTPRSPQANAPFAGGTPRSPQANAPFAGDGPRIHLSALLGASRKTDLLAFYGPAVLAGDRAFTPSERGAVFPGIYPPAGPDSVSVVPAPDKIATPVMAATGRDICLALVWDSKQKWAANQASPAARFDAPGPDSGLGSAVMSLFVPSVGAFVKEDGREATQPYTMQHIEHVGIEAWVVLDHASRCACAGDLSAWAIQQWRAVYGKSE